MPKRKKKPFSLQQAAARIKKAAATTALPSLKPDDDALLPAEQRLKALYEQLEKTGFRKAEYMFCFIMYDIEDNKVRRLVAKYLEKNGCLRIQRSVFFASLHRSLYKKMFDDLRDIQQMYDNHDTIIFLPAGEEMIHRIGCIGQQFEFELLSQSKSTIFI